MVAVNSEEKEEMHGWYSEKQQREIKVTNDLKRSYKNAD